MIELLRECELMINLAIDNLQRAGYDTIHYEKLSKKLKKTTKNCLNKTTERLEYQENQKNMKPIEGATIITYGQKVKISQVIEQNNKYRIYLEHPIVVPTSEYTRDYITVDEIQKYEEF